VRRRSAIAALGLALAACGGGGGDGFDQVDDAPSFSAVIDLWAFAPDDVWLLDGSATIQRYDGAAWTPLETPSTGGLGCVYAVSSTDVWLCANDQVLHYDGAELTAIDASASGLEGMVGIYATSEELFAIGGDARVARFDGETWTSTIAGSPFKSSIWGSAGDDVYALDTFELVHFDGTTWSTVELPPEVGGGDGQVWGTAADDVWVMTGSSFLAHYDGAAWTAVETEDFVGDLAAVWGPAPDDLWGVGGAGSIAHYDGESWDEVAHQDIGAPYLRQLSAVHGSSSEDVWVVGVELGEGGTTPLVYHRGEQRR
jgi:hypothetical protein